eukprot:473958_1
MNLIQVVNELKELDTMFLSVLGIVPQNDTFQVVPENEQTPENEYTIHTSIMQPILSIQTFSHHSKVTIKPRSALKRALFYRSSASLSYCCLSELKPSYSHDFGVDLTLVVKNFYCDMLTCLYNAQRSQLPHFLQFRNYTLDKKFRNTPWIGRFNWYLDTVDIADELTDTVDIADELTDTVDIADELTDTDEEESDDDSDGD